MFSKISHSIPAQMLVNNNQGHNATRRSESGEHATTGLQALRQKQQKKMQESLAALQEMQKNLAPKKQAAARAGRLKQRLEMLRDMLAKMPPGNYKALAQELKQIAKELAALGKSLGGGGSAITAPALNFQVGTEGAEAGTEDAAASGGEAEAAALAAAAAEAAANAEASSGSAEAERLAGEAAASVNAEGEQNGALDENGSERGDDRGDQSASKIGGSATNDDAQDDKTLRALLVDAKKLFKQVADLLKAKMLDFDKEARKIFADIDDSLRKLDDSLRGGENPLYSALGELSAGGVDGGETAASGISINVSA